MEYLLELGFTEEFLEELKENYNEGIQLLITGNRKYVIDAVNYFRKIGITESNIEELLLNNIDYFFMNLDEIKGIFGKYDIPKMVELLNEDISIIDRI